MLSSHRKNTILDYFVQFLDQEVGIGADYVAAATGGKGTNNYQEFKFSGTHFSTSSFGIWQNISTICLSSWVPATSLIMAMASS